MAFSFLRRLAQGDEEPGGGVFGFLEEKTRPLIKADKAILEFGKDIARMFPRGGASIGATIGEYTNPLLGLPKVSSFETDQFGGLGKAVLGERPIESGQKRRAGIQEVLEGSRMRDYAGPLSFLGAGAAIGLEVTPFGKGKKGIEELIKAKTPQEVKKIVKGISDEGARAIAITKDRNAIGNLLSKEGAIGKNVGGEIPRGGAPKILFPDEPVAQMAKPPNVIERMFVSTTGQLSKMGPHGQQLAEGASRLRDISQKGQAGFIKTIPTVTKLKKDEFDAFHNALNALNKGEKVNVSPTVQQAIDEWSRNIPAIRQRAAQAGIKVGDLGPYYFPRDYAEYLSKSKNINKAAEDLVRTGQAENLGEAQAALNYMRRNYSTTFSHFEKSRLKDIPGYDTSKNAVINYVKGAYDNIARAEVFGPGDTLAKETIDSLGKQGYSVEAADRLFQVATGVKTYDQPVLQHVSEGVRAFQRVTKLGLSSILNATQSVNTIAVGGVWNSAKGFRSLLTKEGKAYVDDTGTVLESVLSGLREQAGASGKVLKPVTAPGFRSVEKFNRTFSSLAGRERARQLAKKGNVDELREFGVTGKIGKTLTKDQEIEFSRKFTERVQFLVDPQDLPPWASTPTGKMAVQFRTFIYKNTGFVYNHIVKEAMRGNVLPLARYLTIGIPLGLTAGAVRGVLRGRPPLTGVRGRQDTTDEDPSEVAITMEGLGNIGAFGLAGDARFLFENKESYRLPQYITGAVGGPTASETAKLTQNISDTIKGSPKSLGRQALGQIPVAGPLVSSKVFSFSNLGKSQSEYVDKLKQQGASKGQIKATESFFQNLKAGAAGKDDALREFDEAYLAGDEAEARRIATEYNEKLDEQILKWKDKYGEYVTQDLRKAYRSRRINATERFKTVKRREKRESKPLQLVPRR